MLTLQEAEDLLAFAKKVLARAEDNKRPKAVLKVLENNVKEAKKAVKAARKKK